MIPISTCSKLNSKFMYVSDQKEMHCWCHITRLRNALWLPNLVGRTSYQSVMHCWYQKSCRGQPGQPQVKLPRSPYGCLMQYEEPLTIVLMHFWGQQGPSSGQIACKCIVATDLVGRIHDKNVTDVLYSCCCCCLL